MLISGLIHPRSIVVDSLAGKMYWSNWPQGPPLEELKGDSAKIEVSWLDGSHRKTFLGHDIIWPNGLSLDSKGQRLYWCDSYLQRIESMSLINEQDRKVHLSHKEEKRLSQPYGLTFYANQVFWSEFEKGHIMKLDLQSQNTSLVLQENPQSFALKIFDREKQKISPHPCRNNPCAELCLVQPGENKHTCKCSDGKMGEKCIPIPQWKPPSHCQQNQFKCKSNFKCIDKRYT